jgi:hypothetical protein
MAICVEKYGVRAFRENDPIERQYSICSRAEKDDFFSEDSLEAGNGILKCFGILRFHTHPTRGLDDEGDWLAGSSGVFCEGGFESSDGFSLLGGWSFIALKI